MKFHIPTAAIFKTLLKRKLPFREAIAKQVNLMLNYEEFLEEVIDSREFNEMVLGSIVAKNTQIWNGKYIFFMHIPKTAGTSFNNALYQLYPFPAIQTYGREGSINKKDLNKYSFWPLLSGHANVEDFPETHRGVTIFRDTKSRILSQYRQQQSYLRTHYLRQERIEPQAARTAFARNNDFSTWLRERVECRYSSIKRFIPRDYWAENIHSFIDCTNWNSPDIKMHISKSLGRFDACAWCYKSSDMHEALMKILDFNSLDVAGIFPEKNTFESKKRIRSLLKFIRSIKKI